MSEKIWWFHDYDANLIHKFNTPDERIAHCGISKVDDISFHGITHAPFDMPEEQIKQLAGKNFGYICPECCNEIIADI